MICRSTLFALALSILASSATARPYGQDPVLPELVDSESRSPAEGRPGLSVRLFADTVSYGGTFWASDSMRWEAIRDSCWRFNTGVGSSINTGANPNKPVGYHQTMEGWYGIDQTLNPIPYFRRSSTCAINGSFSAWAGVTVSEANALCYPAGQGYGNSWNLYFVKTFAYPGSGTVSLSYKYAVECETAFDYAFVLIDTTGALAPGAAGAVELTSYTGTLSGTQNLVLQPGTTLRSTAGPVSIWFNARSDGSYSDEDGLNATVCGHSAFDDIALGGAITDFTDFETGSNGWTQGLPTTGVGDFSHLASRGDLPPPAVFCPCAAQDSVLVFFDQSSTHPLDQDNIAASPWINLLRGGNSADFGRPLRLMLYSVYAEMPIANYVFVQIRARYYPAVCAASGAIHRTPWKDQNIVFYFGESPFCTATSTTQLRDYSAVIEPTAEQIQLGFGMLNLCRTAPFGTACSGVTNTTPWLDNLALGIGGSKTAPAVTLLTFDRLQDSFAQDGTLNPASPGRVDTNSIKNGSTPAPNTILRDTLVARTGASTNTEVRIYFAVRPGPFTSLPALAARAARWTAAAGIPPTPGAYGNTWYSARIDTAEQGGTVSPGNWMATYHESDPGFQGTDRTSDPLDPSQLENEILPDRVLTPGSRIDYFIAARYIPPDPRNVGGVSWYIEQDTTGRRYREMEVLPSSTKTDTSWNCVLYVDHHGDRSFDEQRIEEQALTAALGLGGFNAEGTRYDRFDNETPSSGQLSFGRSIQTNYGCSPTQVFAWKAVVWHSATLSSLVLTDEDANILRPWLTISEIGNNRFWASGDGLVRSMSTSNETATVSFLQNVLGVLATCNTVREAACPSGSVLDSTFCLPLGTVAGSHFATTLPVSARGNGCNALRSFDVNGVNPAVVPAGSVKGQLSYQKSSGPANFASVTRHNTVDVDFRTVTDGVALGALRTQTGDPHSPSGCSDAGAATARTASVLNWFAVPQRCGLPVVGAAPEDSLPSAPKYRTRLGMAVPNPMRSTTLIRFEVASDGTDVRILVLDVSGRPVRSLVNAAYTKGTQSVQWDGMTDGGRPVAAGLYFYRLTAPGISEARKILVVR